MANRSEPRPRTHAERTAARDGYFPPESVIRRLGNSPVTPLLGGGAAVLLQVAHPLVAAGVAEHSGFDRDLWRRLLRTMRALYLITFGTRQEAEHAGAAVQAVHTRVHGTTATQLGIFPAGTRYAASDPELMTWVHATLVATSLAAYERFVHRVSNRDREQYYREMTVVAELMGASADALPGSYEDFREYYYAQLAGPLLAVTAPARTIARVIIATPLPAPLRMLAPAHRLSTARLLPPRLRREYGLRWTPLHELVLPLAGGSVRYGTAPALTLAVRLRPGGRALAAF